jgi:CAAX protease family protein
MLAGRAAQPKCQRHHRNGASRPIPSPFVGHQNGDMPFWLVVVVGAALALAADLAILRSSGPWVRRRGRRVRLAIGLVAWIAEAVLVAACLLLIGGAILPASVVATAGILNVTWVEVTAAAALLLALGAVSRSWGAPSLTEVGLSAASGWSWRDAAIGVALGLLTAAIPLVAGLAGGWARIDRVGDDAGLAGEVGMAAVFFAATAVLEETFFRGALFVLLARITNVRLAAAVSVVAFSLAHLLNPGASALAAIGVGIAGLGLVVAVLRSGSLWLPIGFHLGWNWALGSVYGFAVSGLGFGSVVGLAIDPDASTLLTGGAFGPEASLPGITGFLGFLVGAWLYTRRRAHLRVRAEGR